jgi:hypothetical protein
MSRAKHIAFEEFAGNLAQHLSTVRAEKVSLVVEYASGERVLIKPYPPARPHAGKAAAPQAKGRRRQSVPDPARELENASENISSVGAVYDLDPGSITPG